MVPSHDFVTQLIFASHWLMSAAAIGEVLRGEERDWQGAVLPSEWRRGAVVVAVSGCLRIWERPSRQ